MTQEKEITKQDIQKGLNEIFSGLLKNREIESANTYGTVMNQLLAAYGDQLKDMETFHYLISYEMEEALDYLIQQMYPHVTSDAIHSIVFLYSHYDFYEHQVEGLIRSKEGFACESDKSSWLLQSYLRYLIENIVPDMTRGEKCFWKPHFGTGEEWVKLMNSLMDFYYGKPMNYLQAVKALAVMEPTK